ncbi:Sugar phosphate permease [Burkholderiales bacterium 8X]|nr:Sugar phosphate permease [Burkholderiales bacterium 8X]
MVGLAVAMGMGRFAFTPMLPVMLHEGKLDLQAGGLLASLNYLGYFAGALVCVFIKVRAATMVRGALAATAALLLGMGLVDGFTGWGLLRGAAGVMSAWVFVFASGWGLRRLAETGAPRLQGVIYTGPGIGIAATGLLGGAIGRWGSEAGWIGLGLLSAALVAVVWRVFDDGAHGDVATQPGQAAAPAGAAPNPPSGAGSGAGPDPRRARADANWLIGLYGLAGFGYIITATFLPVIARQALPGSPWPDLFWPLFGLAVIPGALVAASAPVHWDNRLLLAWAYAMQAAGVLLSVVWPSIVGFLLGSLMLGLPFTAITLFAMREARRLRGNSAAGLIGFATASYGIGQILGPLFAAPLAQRTGSFSVPLLGAAAALALGSILFVGVWQAARGRARRGSA